MTRRDKCLTLLNGEPCDRAEVVWSGNPRVDVVTECDLIHGCDGKPCPQAYAAALADPNAVCKHEDGNMWLDAEVPVRAAAAPVPAAAGDWLSARAGVCLRCEKSPRPWWCMVKAGPVNDIVKDPTRDCPDNPPRFVRVVGIQVAGRPVQGGKEAASNAV